VICNPLIAQNVYLHGVPQLQFQELQKALSAQNPTAVEGWENNLLRIPEWGLINHLKAIHSS
jgi:hypothetical protein